MAQVKGKHNKMPVEECAWCVCVVESTKTSAVSRGDEAIQKSFVCQVKKHFGVTKALHVVVGSLHLFLKCLFLFTSKAGQHKGGERENEGGIDEENFHPNANDI